jgi:hypothetical protein
MKQVFDPLRRQWVDATPEELVRQSWLQRMIQELGYPKSFLAIERELKTLPHLKEYQDPLPNRRIDMICFLQMEPLLLIECKQRLSQEAMNQALAYNQFVKAPYVAVVDRNQIRFRFRDREVDYLPTYNELI